MKRKLWFVLALLVITATVLSACGGNSAGNIKPPAPAATSNTANNNTANNNTANNNNAGSSSAGNSSANGPIVLNGAGATFPLPVYTEWIQMYKSVAPNVTINYQGIGSGGGQKAIFDGTVDFAGSDSLLSEEQYKKMPDLQMLPMLAGAVVPIFNIPNVDSLVLDGPTLAAIYLGKITKWNDPAIAKLNPNVSLPDEAITVAHRSDGSGTTEIFTSYLGAVSQEWKDKVGIGKAVEWPVDNMGQGVGGKGNPGVAQAVQSTPYSIGYVELAYAKSNHIPAAKLVNAAGNVVEANAETMQDAMAAFADAFDERLTAKIVNAPGKKSWPIMGYTYLIIHMKDNKDCAKTKALLNFIKWAITSPEAAKKAAELGYAALPQAVQQKVLAKLQQVECNGQKVMP